jgi:hypothetical protein
VSGELAGTDLAELDLRMLELEGTPRRDEDLTAGIDPLDIGNSTTAYDRNEQKVSAN